MSPFRALYGYSPPNFPIQLPNEIVVEVVDQFLQERQLLSQLLKENLEKAQNRMKQQTDKKRTEREFSVGNLVYLKLQPYRQTSLALRHSLKLSAKYYGPYKITAKIGKVAYRLELPTCFSIHPVFHISKLKKKVKDKVSVTTDLPKLQDNQAIVVPESILQTRFIMRRTEQVEQVLIKWYNLPMEDATWENRTFITAQFLRLPFLGSRKF
ncbi:hypothetical protein MANES_02G218460v8 [Manihot esculenta]|uniref:Uncharacterized protein n=1 Tax=Manihot esculenta TaxID=3983 RepID=A0ACB7IAV4_MANES|nr:hypothetical protein MANES_02G218460v8 [Manihot esculenta]